MNAVIIDDEFSSREVLKSLLKTISPEMVIAGEASNVKAAYELICREGPDLVFLDIIMPFENGFDLLRKFEEIPFDLIFVTSFDEYAIDAIRFSALDYLLKPIELPLLEAAIEKAEKRILSGNFRLPQIVNLLHNTDKEQREKKVALHHNEKVVFLTGNEIVCIVGDGNYSHIHTCDCSHYTSCKTIKDYEIFFDGEGGFVRIGKGCLINVNHIKEYSKGSACIVTMNNNMTFEMSRRKKKEALEILKTNHLKKNISGRLGK